MIRSTFVEYLQSNGEHFYRMTVTMKHSARNQRDTMDLELNIFEKN